MRSYLNTSQSDLRVKFRDVRFKSEVIGIKIKRNVSIILAIIVDY